MVPDRAVVDESMEDTTEVHMQEQPTCGKGLAENSAIPARVAQMIAAMAGNLELHTKALDVTDPYSKDEYDAYRQLVDEHRQIAAHLQATADQMARYRDLPMGRHDQNAMTDPKVFQAFEAFVKTKEELLALLQDRAEQDRTMLAQMRGMGAEP